MSTSYVAEKPTQLGSPYSQAVCTTGHMVYTCWDESHLLHTQVTSSLLIIGGMN